MKMWQTKILKDSISEWQQSKYAHVYSSLNTFSKSPCYVRAVLFTSFFTLNLFEKLLQPVYLHWRNMKLCDKLALSFRKCIDYPNPNSKACSAYIDPKCTKIQEIRSVWILYTFIFGFMHLYISIGFLVKHLLKKKSSILVVFHYTPWFPLNCLNNLRMKHMDWCLYSWFLVSLSIQLPISQITK